MAHGNLVTLNPRPGTSISVTFTAEQAASSIVDFVAST